MRWIGTLKIEKRPMSQWLLLCIFALPILWGTLFHFLNLPSFLKYAADLAWVTLLALMVIKRNFVIQRKILPLFLLTLSFFLYCFVVYVLDYQSIIYFLWGTRNNFRFYVFFFAVVMFLRERDTTKIFRVMDIIFWINVPVTMVQYFMLGYKQDYLGGIFGVEQGANAFTIIFFSIVLSRSLLRFMEKKESLLFCSAKCVAALFLSALSELKFFFAFFIIILIFSSFLTSFSWRKAVIFSLSALLVLIASTLLVTLFEFEGFLSIDAIWENATQESYSSTESVNRLSAIPSLAQTLVKELPDRLFGLGLGNCDTSSFAICNTPFYQTYGHLRYNYFSCSFLFLEVGYTGLVIYTMFFVACFFMIRKRMQLKLCDRQNGCVALILLVLSIVLIFYNASLRMEAAYMIYFVLAFPFLEREKVLCDEMEDPTENE